jgi:hypothetical protein
VQRHYGFDPDSNELSPKGPGDTQSTTYTYDPVVWVEVGPDRSTAYDYANQDAVNGFDVDGRKPTYEGRDTTQDAFGREINGCASTITVVSAYWCNQLRNDYGTTGSNPITVVKNAVVTFSTGARHHVTETTVGTVLIVGGAAYVAGGAVIGTDCTVFTRGLNSAECVAAGAHVAQLGWGMAGVGAGVYVDVYVKGKRERRR